MKNERMLIAEKSKDQLRGYRGEQGGGWGQTLVLLGENPHGGQGELLLSDNLKLFPIETQEV